LFGVTLTGGDVSFCFKNVKSANRPAKKNTIYTI